MTKKALLKSLRGYISASYSTISLGQLIRRPVMTLAAEGCTLSNLSRLLFAAPYMAYKVGGYWYKLASSFIADGFGQNMETNLKNHSQ